MAAFSVCWTTGLRHGIYRWLLVVNTLEYDTLVISIRKTRQAHGTFTNPSIPTKSYDSYESSYQAPIMPGSHLLRPDLLAAETLPSSWAKHSTRPKNLHWLTEPPKRTLVPAGRRFHASYGLLIGISSVLEQSIERRLMPRRPNSLRRSVMC